MQLLLVISGNVELHLAPWTAKYSCGEWGNVLTINIAACDICNTWYHCKYEGMKITIFACYVKNSEIEWEFIQCDLPNKVDLW